MPKLPHTQQGIALLTALLVMSIAVMIAAAVISTQHYDVKIQNNMQQLERAYQYSSGIEQMAGLWLQRDLKLNETDSLTDTWAIPLPELPIQDGETVIGSFSGRIEDLQGLFNLNTLLNKEDKLTDLGQTLFAKLLEAQSLPDYFRFSVTDWMDKDTTTRNNNSAEADFYLTRTPAYFAANQPFTDPSELFLVRLDSLAPEETREKLDELLKITTATALPSETFTKININTASEALLAALVPDDVEAILSTRQAQPFDQNSLNSFIANNSTNLKEAFKSIVPNPDYKPAKDNEAAKGEEFNSLQWSDVFGVTSHYFRLRGLIKIGVVRLNTVTLLERTDTGEIHILMRRFEYTTEHTKAADETTLFNSSI
ncbi:type II secretion system minor pseudopilin GspK [Thiofilum flexile]|uniref:type II secretion system minor pseudopilin GspK n=1 Tax=Thiofilum flexile TaxID=125627 RepID=UPI0003649213|nr:type II secretion system minor pseudopilin GspK [Thiofilum flexile]